jgi:galactose-1-phosphate uridylyltransferase
MISATFHAPSKRQWHIRIVENLYPILGAESLLPGSSSRNAAGLGEKRQNYETVNSVVEQGEKLIAVQASVSRHEWEVHILPIKHHSNFPGITDEVL